MDMTAKSLHGYNRSRLNLPNWAILFEHGVTWMKMVSVLGFAVWQETKSLFVLICALSKAEGT